MGHILLPTMGWARPRFGPSWNGKPAGSNGRAKAQRTPNDTPIFAAGCARVGGVGLKRRFIAGI